MTSLNEEAKINAAKVPAALDLKPYIDEDWHGYRCRDVQVLVGPLEGFKSIAMYVLEGGKPLPICFFKSEQQAKRALAILDTISQEWCKVIWTE